MKVEGQRSKSKSEGQSQWVEVSGSKSDDYNCIVVVVVVVVDDDPVVGLGCEDWERCMGRKVSGQESKSYLHIAVMK